MPIMNMVGGGSGKTPFAFVLVTYPAGSTVTCTNSSGSKDISSTQKLFYINSSAVPFSCVVTATDGTHSATRTVSITYEGQSNLLTLQYRTYLYDAGNEYTSITGGWVGKNRPAHSSFVSQGVAPTVTKNASNMVAKISGSGKSGTLATTNAVNLSQYTKLCVEMTAKHSENNKDYYVMAFIDGNQKFTDASAYLNVKSSTSATKTLYTLDISSLRGTSKVIGIGINGMNSVGAGAEVTIYSVYME